MRDGRIDFFWNFIRVLSFGFLFFSVGPVAFEFIFFEDVGRDDLRVDRLLVEHNEGVHVQFGLVFVKLFTVMEGSVELLKDGNGLEEEGDVKFGEVDTWKGLALLDLLVLPDYGGVLGVELTDEVGLDKQFGHLATVHQDCH